MELDDVVSSIMRKTREIKVPRRPDAKLKHPNAPWTGNLKYNALRVLKSPTGMILYVDEAIAPYMPYTNEKWISPRWKGAKNPNEKWWENMSKDFVKDLAKELQGKVKKL